jgi:hypothetical protein
MNPASAAGTDKEREKKYIESLIGELAYSKWVKAGKPPNTTPLSHQGEFPV